MGYWMDRAKQLTGHDESAPQLPAESQTRSEAESVADRNTPSLDQLPPAPPLQAGWLVTYTDSRGHLCGGWDDRQKATITLCLWTGQGWSVHLSNGQAISLTAVRCVGQMNEDGELKAAWSVRQHGYDG
jgi:hypothetical protein